MSLTIKGKEVLNLPQISLKTLHVYAKDGGIQYTVVPNRMCNYNEAYSYKMEATAVSLGVIGADVITFFAGLVIDAVNLSAGAVTLAWDAVDLFLISSDVNAAYEAVIPLGVLTTSPQNDYMYYGSSGVDTNGWRLHVFITGRGWVNALYQLTLSGVVSPYISLVCHDFQMNMGQITFGLDCINGGSR